VAEFLSIRHRYAHEEGLCFEDLPALSNGNLDFAPVYTLENEYLEVKPGVKYSKVLKALYEKKKRDHKVNRYSQV